MTVTNYICVCFLPFFTYNGQCICASKLNSSMYYLVDQGCFFCPPNCNCSSTSGCYSCDTLSNRNIQISTTSSQTQKYTCFCISPAVEINLTCICIEPYSIDCECLNVQYPNLYFLSNQQCKKCPVGCKCNSTGCYQCDPSSNRDINNQCTCLDRFQEINGTCFQCDFPYIISGNSCICPENSSLFYFYNPLNTCNMCPNGCSCSQSLGCYQCTNNTRIVALQPLTSKYSCLCKPIFIQNILQGICSCGLNYIYNSTTNSCQCSPPFTLISNNQCVCSTAISPNSYTQTNGCISCPQGCLCSNLGCFYCNSASNRNVTPLNATYYVCYCNDYSPNQYPDANCIYTCASQYYWIGSSCVSCHPGCQQCNASNGNCTVCYQSSYSINANGLCICSSDPNYISYSALTCMCVAGMFEINATCYPCPINCKTCHFRDYIINTAQFIEFICTECYSLVFRNADPTCSCIQYYIEAVDAPKQYCCHWSCLTCNLNGCTSCLNGFFRILNTTDLNNVTCACQTGFIESGSITANSTCLCPKHTYLRDSICHPCPYNCSDCSIINQYIVCNLCSANRVQIEINVSVDSVNESYYLCVCPAGFVENQPLISICSPKYCTDVIPTSSCTNCSDNRTANGDGSACICPNNFYEGDYSNCQICMVGCLTCTSKSQCQICDQQQQYYRIAGINVCVLGYSSWYNTYQGTQTSLILVSKAAGFTFFKLSQINLVQLSPDNEFDQYAQYEIPIIEYQVVNGNLFINTLNAQAIDVPVPNTFMFNLTCIIILDSNHSLQAMNVFLLITKPFYTDSSGGIQLNMQMIVMMIYLTMMISLTITLMGFKHNQMVFYLQTLYLFGYSYQDDQMNIVPYLELLRYSCFKFQSSSSASPYDLLNPSWGTYIEESNGNFNNLSKDSNMVRNIGFMMTMATLLFVIDVVVRLLLWTIIKHNKGKLKSISNRIIKYLFRTKQFFHKVFMFPILYFCLLTMSNFTTRDLVAGPFYITSLELAIIWFIYYFAVTLSWVLLETMSKLYRFEMLLEFISDILMSVILIQTVFTNGVILVSLVFILRAVGHIWLRKFYFGKYFEEVGYWQGVVVLLEISSFIVIMVIGTADSLLGIGVSALLLQIIINLLVLREERQNHQFDIKKHNFHEVGSKTIVLFS